MLVMTKKAKEVIKVGVSRRSIPKQNIRDFFSEACLLMPAIFNDSIRFGISEEYVTRAAPPADIQIATSFETVRPTAFLPGKKFNFMQHFEPYFKNEFHNPAYSETLARQSYKHGFHLIANSSWLVRTLHEELGLDDVALCPNAIDHKIFCGQPKLSRSREIAIISYGGRNATWKGFREMAQAVAIARANCPDTQIEWRVYGDALLPPDNPISAYKPLGFLAPVKLAEEYRKADILLSASWYESFPLFPIEAMACGLPVVTTQWGTEEYAIPNETAEIVQPRSPESIAEGLLKLIRDPDYRYRIAGAGNDISQTLTWERSVARMESILLSK
jgi:glycosyltransferase involved in cell wall biosynthesis